MSSKETHGVSWVFGHSEVVPSTKNSDFCVRLSHLPSLFSFFLRHLWSERSIQNKFQQKSSILPTYYPPVKHGLLGNPPFSSMFFPVQMYILFGDFPRSPPCLITGRQPLKHLSYYLHPIKLYEWKTWKNIPLNQHDVPLSHDISCHSCWLLSWC